MFRLVKGRVMLFQREIFIESFCFWRYLFKIFINHYCSISIISLCRIFLHQTCNLTVLKNIFIYVRRTENLLFPETVYKCFENNCKTKPRNFLLIAVYFWMSYLECSSGNFTSRARCDKVSNLCFLNLKNFGMCS